MIAQLHIRGLGVISAAVVEFSSGLVAFTGETGAGKTMVVTALGLVLGDRADTRVLSVGQDRTEVDAVVVVPAGGPAATRVLAAEGSIDPDGGVVVTRSISGSGRGRAALGGVAVPVGTLHEFGELVAQRHSQSDQILLRKPRRQRRSLDEYGGASLAAARGAYDDCYRRFGTVSMRLHELTADSRRRHHRVAELQAALAEIDALDPKPDEDQTLPEAIARLTNAEALRTSATAALQALDWEDDETGDATAALGQALAALQKAGIQDRLLAEIGQRLAVVAEAVVDLTGDLRDYLGGVSADPAELERLHQRRAGLSALLRKYGATAADVLDWAAAARTELAHLDLSDDEIEALRAQVADAVRDLGTAAHTLSAARQAAAKRLSRAVTGELHELSMPKAEFQVEVEQREDEAGLALPDGRTCAFGEKGVDVVRFLLSPHPGSSPAPIGDGASGGELSRIMLALEVVLSEHAPPSVFVFDEVDAGVGGRTATEVGRRLARLAARSQVFVVTHLAQVASFADQHILVEKDQSGQVTATSVHEVAGEERTTELSRMLSGQEDSAAARRHAQELLRLAVAERRTVLAEAH